MTKGRALIVGCLILAIQTGCGSPQQSGDMFDQQQIQDASFYTYWQAQVPLGRGDTVSDCHLVDDNLYVTSAKGHFFALQADKGLLRWCLKVTEPDYTIYPPRHLVAPDGRGPVVVVTTTRIAVFDRYSGDTLLSTPIPFPPAGGAVGDMTRLYLGSNDGNMYSLLWCHPYGNEPIERWRLTAGSPIASTPEFIAPDTLFFTTERGCVVSCGGFDKRRLLTSRTEGAITADPFVDESGMYVASLDRSVYRFDLSSGTVLWRFRMPKPVRDAPKVVGHTCYQYCDGTGITAIDTDTGQQKWRREDAVRLLATFSGEAAIQTSGGAIDVVDISSGKTSRSFAAQGVSAAVCNTSGNAIFVATADGRITGIQPADTPYLRHQEVAASKAYINRPPFKQTEGQVAPGPSQESGINDPFRSRRDR